MHSFLSYLQKDINLHTMIVSGQYINAHHSFPVYMYNNVE